MVVDLGVALVTVEAEMVNADGGVVRCDNKLGGRSSSTSSMVASTMLTLLITVVESLSKDRMFT